MSWITFDYQCQECDHRWDEMVDREAIPDTLSCPLCAGLSSRCTSFGGSPRASYVDGTKRFSGVRHQRALQKAKRKAIAAGDRAGVREIANEQAKQKNYKS